MEAQTDTGTPRAGGAFIWQNSTVGRDASYWQQGLEVNIPGPSWISGLTWRHIQAQTPQLKVHYRTRTRGIVRVKLQENWEHRV